MTESQEIRTAKNREFSFFGATRFPLYVTAGIAMYLENFQVAGICVGIGAVIEIARRLYYKFID
jgi:hypothetical protein